jgi:hypothetical protein
MIVDAPFDDNEISHLKGSHVIKNGGRTMHVFHGKLHSRNGPALIIGEGDTRIERWYIHGIAHRVDGPAIHNHATDTKSWYIEGVLHREDGPALTVGVEGAADYEEYWYYEGVPHRTNGPAATNNKTGTKEWIVDGKLHRVGKPARVVDGVVNEWYNSGFLSREDGPAIESLDGKGFTEWFTRGQNNRLGGPARISPNGTEFWMEMGKLHREDGPAIVDVVNNNRGWYRNNELHRTNGPAIEYGDGSFEWYNKGKLHRLDGPAFNVGGVIGWYENGVRHSIEGPAVIHPNGDTECWVNGYLHSLDEEPAVVTKDSQVWYANGRIHRDRGPAVIKSNGYKANYQFGALHSIRIADGKTMPAVVESDGTKKWYAQGLLHREGLPAIEYSGEDRENEYYHYGTKITQESSEAYSLNRQQYSTSSNTTNTVKKTGYTVLHDGKSPKSMGTFDGKSIISLSDALAMPIKVMDGSKGLDESSLHIIAYPDVVEDVEEGSEISVAERNELIRSDFVNEIKRSLAGESNEVIAKAIHSMDMLMKAQGFPTVANRLFSENTIFVEKVEVHSPEFSETGEPIIKSDLVAQVEFEETISPDPVPLDELM